MWRLGHMVQAGSSNFDEWVKAIARRRQNTYRIIYEAIVSALFHKKNPSRGQQEEVVEGEHWIESVKE